MNWPSSSLELEMFKLDIRWAGGWGKIATLFKLEKMEHIKQKKPCKERGKNVKINYHRHQDKTNTKTKPTPTLTPPPSLTTQHCFRLNNNEGGYIMICLGPPRLPYPEASTDA